MRLEEAKAFFCIFSKSYLGAFLEGKKEKIKGIFLSYFEGRTFPFHGVLQVATPGCPLVGGSRQGRSCVRAVWGAGGQVLGCVCAAAAPLTHSAQCCARPRTGPAGPRLLCPRQVQQTWVESYFCPCCKVDRALDACQARMHWENGAFQKILLSVLCHFRYFIIKIPVGNSLVISYMVL